MCRDVAASFVQGLDRLSRTAGALAAAAAAAKERIGRRDVERASLMHPPPTHWLFAVGGKVRGRASPAAVPPLGTPPPGAPTR